MYRVFYISYFFLLLSCQRDESGTQLCSMSITPSLSTIILTKNLINGDNIQSKHIGIHITDTAGNALYCNQADYNNILLSYNDSWVMSYTVYLSPSPAKVFAYYPYSDIADDLSGTGLTATRLLNIPATQIMTNQVDYLWTAQDKTISEGNSNINNINANVAIKMNHSLAQVAFVIYKEGYTGYGALTQIQIKDNSPTPCLKIKKNITNDLRMRLADGVVVGGETSSTLIITGITNTIDLVSDPGTSKDSLNGLKNGYMLIAPVLIADQTNVQFIFTIDGTDYSASLGSGTLNWQQGNLYIYKGKLTKSKLLITGVTVTPWSSNSDIDLTTEGGIQ